MSYVIVWEFHVREGQEREFEDVYGPSGEWAHLFARSPNTAAPSGYGTPRHPNGT